MVRRTSLQAFKRINDEKLMGPFQTDVYNIIFEHGPMTAGQVAFHYQKIHPRTHRGRNENAKRIYELVQYGVAYDTKVEVPCPMTGFNAVLWDLNEKLPNRKKPVKYDKILCCNCGGTGYVEQGRLF